RGHHLDRLVHRVRRRNCEAQPREDGHAVRAHIRVVVGHEDEWRIPLDVTRPAPASRRTAPVETTPAAIVSSVLAHMRPGCYYGLGWRMRPAAFVLSLAAAAALAVAPAPAPLNMGQMLCPQQ